MVIFVLTAQSISAQIQCDSIYKIESSADTIEFKMRTFNCGARDIIIDFYTYTIPDMLSVWDTQMDTFILGDIWLPISNYPAPPGSVVIDGPAIITPQGIAYTTFPNVPFDTFAGTEGLARYIIPQAEFDSITIKVVGNDDPQTAFDFIVYCVNPPDYEHPVVIVDTLVCSGINTPDSLLVPNICIDTLYITNYTDGGLVLDDYVVDVCFGDSITPYPLHDTLLYPDYVLNTEPIYIDDVITIEYVVYDGFCSQVGTITYEPIYELSAGDTLIVADAGELIEVDICGFDLVFTELDNLFGCTYGTVVYEDTTYDVQMYNGVGCIYSYVIDVEVYEQIYIPNAFSPNGDGNNDVFYAQMSDNVIAFDLQLYDRYGQLIHVGQNEWDGKVDGMVVNSGVYVYVFEFTLDNGKVLTIKGDVTVYK